MRSIFFYCNFAASYFNDKKMKKVIIFLILCCISSWLTAQNKTLTITNNNKGLSDVKIYNNNQIIGITDSNGICEIDESITKVRCNYLEIIDTTIDLLVATTINFKINLFNEIEINDKYNACKHFQKLLEITNKYSAHIDTTLYYKAQIENRVSKTEQKEIFEAILMANYNGKTGKYSFYIVKIDNYYNSIEDSIYKKLESITFNLFTNEPFSSKNLKYYNCKNKNLHINNIYSENDTIIFCNILEKGQIKNYFKFINNTLVTIEYKSLTDYHRLFLRIKNYYFLRNYCYNKNVYIKNCRYFFEFKYNISKIQQYIIHTLNIENIPQPNIINNFNDEFIDNGLKTTLKYLKNKYPNLIIPSNPEPFYKFDF